MSQKFNAQAAQHIDQDTVEQDGSQFPAISFHNGDPTRRKEGGIAYEGGWFVSDGGPDMTDHGWKKESFINRDGEEVTGYWSPTISVAVICARKRWIVNGQPYAWNDFEKAKAVGKPRGHQQYLVLLKDAEDLGPFVLGLKGHAGMSFGGSKEYSTTGVLSCFNRTVIAAANARSKPFKWPFRAFWVTVGAAKDAKGQPAFIEVGLAGASSKILLPVPVGLPEKAADVNLDEYYIGNDGLVLVNDLYKEHQPWVEAWANFAQQNGAAKNGKPAEPVATEDELAEMGV